MAHCSLGRPDREQRPAYQFGATASARGHDAGMSALTQAVVSARERANRSIISSTCVSVMTRGGQKQSESPMARTITPFSWPLS